MRGKLVSYFLNNAAKICLYGMKISQNIEIGQVFQSRPFFISVVISIQVALAPLTCAMIDKYLVSKVGPSSVAQS